MSDLFDKFSIKWNQNKVQNKLYELFVKQMPIEQKLVETVRIFKNFNCFIINKFS